MEAEEQNWDEDIEEKEYSLNYIFGDVMEELNNL